CTGTLSKRMGTNRRCAAKRTCARCRPEQVPPSSSPPGAGARSRISSCDPRRSGSISSAAPTRWARCSPAASTSSRTRCRWPITSLEWLSRAHPEADEAARAGWDLAVFDEAHHLRGARAYEVANAVARRTWGLLLLTATPLQLDPGEYHALLRLVDPAPPASEDELRARLARQGELSVEVRALLAGDSSAAQRIAELFPGDADLSRLTGDALLAHL